MNDLRKVKEVIIVEGRYDKNTVSQVVDAAILETSGFGLFNDKEKMELIRRLAADPGVIVLTDSDSAGFLIRNRIKGAVGENSVKHAYIPEIEGKERRKSESSKEGLLGVEGMRPEVIIEALERCGATFANEDNSEKRGGISKADLFESGLSGGPHSAEKRRALARILGLPTKLSANALLDILNALYSREEFFVRIKDLEN